MKIVVLAGGLSTERDVSLASGAGICRTLRENGHDAFLLDVYLGFPYDSDKLEEVFTLPGAGLEIAEGIKTTEPDLVAIKASREDQSDCFVGPNVIDICRLADIVFMGLHGDVGENAAETYLPALQLHHQRLPRVLPFSSGNCASQSQKLHTVSDLVYRSIFSLLLLYGFLFYIHESEGNI